MRRTRIKIVLRNIRGSLNRFLSIAAIVALGTGFLAGLISTTPDMEDAMDKYMDDTHWYDIDVKSQLGFSESDVQKIAAVDGVAAVQRAYVTDAVLISDEQSRYTARIFGYVDDDTNAAAGINGLQLVSGRMPQNANECVIQSPSGYTTALPANGSSLMFLNNESGYAYDKLLATGVVKSPMFISAESEPSLKGSGNITIGVYVRKDFYTRASYTDVYVTVKGASSLSTWSTVYKKLIASTVASLEPVVNEIGEEKVALLKTAATEMKQSLQHVEDVKHQIAIDEQLRVAQSEEVASLLQAHGGERASLLAKNISSTAAEVKQTITKSTSSSGVENSGSERSEVKRSGNESSENEGGGIESMGTVIDDQIAQLVSKQKQLWSVDTRDNNTGYASYQSNIEKIAAMSKVFPVFFYFIAMLVSLTTMTRLVEERRTGTGTLKALGFSNGELLSEYLLYAFLATILGSVVGLTVGFKLFPAVISNAYGMMYSLPHVQTPFRWNIAIIAGSIALVCIMLATLGACLTETTATPASLMTQKAPSPGKRILLEHISFVWKKIPFSGKVTARNMFRYKKRLYMTIAGVAGCSALLVTGFGLHDSIYDIVNKQFGVVNKYDLTLMFNNESAPETDETLRSFLNDTSAVIKWTPFSNENGHVMHGENTQPVYICVPQHPETLSDFIDFHERLSHKEIPFTKNGVVLTEKLCEQLGVKTGDTVTIENTDGTKAEATVLGGAENYVYAYVYLYPETYQSLFHKRVSYTSALCNLSSEVNNNETVERLMNSPAVLYASSTKSLKNTAYNTMRSINVVVIVLIISSGLLSMIVLYNLANINICERKREIATLLVLGYNEREARRYIFREIDCLSFMGIALGLVLGVPLHSFIVRTLEVNAAMWGRTIYPLSFMYAAVISVVFTFMVNLVMRKTLREINMVESMKTAD